MGGSEGAWASHGPRAGRPVAGGRGGGALRRGAAGGARRARWMVRRRRREAGGGGAEAAGGGRGAGRRGWRRALAAPTHPAPGPDRGTRRPRHAVVAARDSLQRRGQSRAAGAAAWACSQLTASLLRPSFSSGTRTPRPTRPPMEASSAGERGRRAVVLPPPVQRTLARTAPSSCGAHAPQSEVSCPSRPGTPAGHGPQQGESQLPHGLPSLPRTGHVRRRQCCAQRPSQSQAGGRGNDSTNFIELWPMQRTPEGYPTRPR